MLKKLLAYLAVLVLALGAVAANKSFAQDAKPIEQAGCCASLSQDTD